PGVVEARVDLPFGVGVEGLRDLPGGGVDGRNGHGCSPRCLSAARAYPPPEGATGAPEQLRERVVGRRAAPEAAKEAAKESRPGDGKCSQLRAWAATSQRPGTAPSTCSSPATRFPCPGPA